MHILHIDSSLKTEGSVSRELTARILDQLLQAHPLAKTQYRDFGRSPMEHYFLGKTDTSVLDQFLAADVVVIGAPMYNFSLPSALKSWIDHILVAGKTFRYTENGPEGLVGDKIIIVATSSGGEHTGQPTDFVEPYLRMIFGFIGIKKPIFIRAQGVDLSSERRAVAMEKAMAEIHGLGETITS